MLFPDTSSPQSMLKEKENMLNLRKRKVAHSLIKEDIERVLDENTPFAISESFRMLHTNVLYLPIEDKCRKIAVTSPISGEGKSYISVNLSITLANNSNKKILLIDMDMRVPRIRKLLKNKLIDPSKTGGLSEYLAGIDETPNIQKTTVENLDVLLSGMETSNPIGLINSSRMSTIINELSQKYDYIIFDTPPINIVTDALLILDKVNGYILSCRANYSNVNVLNGAIESIKSVGGEVFGVVLTEANSKNYSKSKYRYSKGNYT